MQFEKREDQRTNKHGRVISRAGGHNLVPTCPGVQEVRGGRGQQQPTNKARPPTPAPVPGSCELRAECGVLFIFSFKSVLGGPPIQT